VVWYDMIYHSQNRLFKQPPTTVPILRRRWKITQILRFNSSFNPPLGNPNPKPKPKHYIYPPLHSLFVLHSMRNFLNCTMRNRFLKFVFLRFIQRYLVYLHLEITISKMFCYWVCSTCLASLCQCICVRESVFFTFSFCGHYSFWNNQNR